MNGGIIEVFAKCPTCGADGVRVRKLKEWAVKNDYDVITYKLMGRNTGIRRDRWKYYLEKFNIDPVAIIVFSDSNVMRLDEWKP